MKKYFKYNPIILSKDSYSSHTITKDNSKIDYCLIFLDERDASQYIYFICYEKNGNLYDLITDDILVKLNYSKGLSEFKNNKIYIEDKSLEEVSVLFTLENTKKILNYSMAEEYKDCIKEKIKTKTKIQDKILSDEEELKKTLKIIKNL